MASAPLLTASPRCFAVMAKAFSSLAVSDGKPQHLPLPLMSTFVPPSASVTCSR